MNFSDELENTPHSAAGFHREPQPPSLEAASPPRLDT
jgi:hypothetical protein